MSGGIFPVTRPSAISDLLSGDPGRQERSLAVLAEVYWRPLYKYVRLRWGKSGEDAEDLTQGFFAGALGREVLSQFDPCLLYTSPSPRDRTRSRMPSSA